MEKMYLFHFQDARTTTTYLRILLRFILTKTMISPFLTTMWDHTDGCAKQYCFASAIYLLSCITLEFSIIIDRAVGAPGNGKDVVYGLNTRYKLMPQLEMSKLLNTKSILDYPIFQVHAGS